MTQAEFRKLMGIRRENFEELKGSTLTKIEGADVGSEETIFTDDAGNQFRLYHSGECCETISLNEIVGDVTDLLDSPLLECEIASSYGHPAPPGADSYTWTFYRMATIKGWVVFRWLGESNGYYSETVNFEEIQ